MAYRVVKTLPKTGTVSRTKVKAAAKSVAKARGLKSVKSKSAGIFRKGNTASGKKQIAFKRPTKGSFWG